MGIVLRICWRRCSKGVWGGREDFVTRVGEEVGLLEFWNYCNFIFGCCCMNWKGDCAYLLFMKEERGE